MANDPFRALAHPIRRGVVERLSHAPATVGQATSGFGVSKPTISRHLKVLEDAGVVVRVIDGRTHQLRLDVTSLEPVGAWIADQRASWERMFDAVEQHLQEGQKNK